MCVCSSCNRIVSSFFLLQNNCNAQVLRRCADARPLVKDISEIYIDLRSLPEACWEGSFLNLMSSWCVNICVMFCIVLLWFGICCKAFFILGMESRKPTASDSTDPCWQRLLHDWILGHCWWVPGSKTERALGRGMPQTSRCHENESRKIRSATRFWRSRI